MDDKFRIGCIPVKLMPNPPADQQECLIENCELCRDEMWVSIKKREFRAKNPSAFQTLCMVCIVKMDVEQGQESEFIDILKLGDKAN